MIGKEQQIDKLIDWNCHLCNTQSKDLYGLEDHYKQRHPERKWSIREFVRILTMEKYLSDMKRNSANGC
jgi:hypothetical protein